MRKSTQNLSEKQDLSW